MNNRIYAELAKSVDRYKHYIKCVNESQLQYQSNEWKEATDKIAEICQRELDHLLPMIEMLNLKYAHKLKFKIET